MKAAIVSLCGLASLFGYVRLAAADPVVFYDGDPNGGSIEDVHVYTGGSYGVGESFREYLYNDFTVPVGQDWTITGMFGNFANPDPTAATTPPEFQYDIRTGMSGSDGGTVVYSDAPISVATSTDLHDQIDGWEGYAYSIDLPTSITLDGGTTYWLSLVPITTDGYNIAVQSTGNANSVNSLKDGQSEYLYWSYLSPVDQFESETGDYSVGMTGTVTLVPEPTAMALLPIAGALLLRRRRKAGLGLFGE